MDSQYSQVLFNQRRLKSEGKKIGKEKSYEHIVSMLTSFDNRIPEHWSSIYKYTIALQTSVEQEIKYHSDASVKSITGADDEDIEAYKNRFDEGLKRCIQ